MANENTLLALRELERRLRKHPDFPAWEPNRFGRLLADALGEIAEVLDASEHDANR